VDRFVAPTREFAMPRRLRALLSFALLTLAPVPARADEAPKLPTTFDPSAVDAYVAGQVKSKGYVGLSLAVVRDGKVVLAKGYGQSSREDGTPVTPDTPFAIGSVTKQFTCACVLKLAEEGKLSVHDKVAKYFPGLTRAGDITLYELMTHTSGYPDYYPLDFVDRRMQRPIDLDELIRQYAGGKLDFEPGTRWSYSNTGYILLGRIVEKVSGESFSRYLEQTILKPLGMTHSFFEPAPGDKRLARGYTTFALGDPEPAPRESAGWIHAAGGLYASAGDLAKWDVGLMDGKVLKPESFRLMTTPRQLADGRVRDYGCGLVIARRDGETILQHSGAVSGFLAYNAMIPRTKSAIVMLVNAEHIDAGALFRELLGLLLKDAAGQPDVPKVKGPPPVEVARELFKQMQAGAVDRGKLGEEFNLYMTDDRLRAAAPRLKALGEPDKVEVENVAERGGMEVATVRFTFKTATVKGLLYRTPDGIVQEFLLSKG
jgi:CubicO group peptidase (beta-lactamase class C family)